MPYASVSELPDAVKRILPAHAQSIFRNAFNSSIARGLSEARAFASAYGAVENAGYQRGADGKYHKVEKAEDERLAEYLKTARWQAGLFSGVADLQRQSDDMVEFVGEITKLDEDKHLVFGWATEIEKGGKIVTDSQGDQIEEADMEKMAYSFVLNVRKAGQMHEIIGVGNLIDRSLSPKRNRPRSASILAKSPGGSVSKLPMPRLGPK